MESVSRLTHGLVDYAGLFPPAELGMSQAVANYSAYRRRPDAGMLGRFVLPASRLDEFADAAAEHLPHGTHAEPWLLAVILTDKFEDEIPAILKFNCSHWVDSPSGYALIDTVEIKASRPESVALIRKTLPEFYRAFIEIPPDQQSPDLFSAIRGATFSAKIRTGGTEENAFPSGSSIVEFMKACRQHGIAFKATAGLHHVVFSNYPLTYQPGSASAEMFGFLNVFAAAIFLFQGSPDADVLAVIQERDPSAFVFDESGMRWRSISVSPAQIDRARKEFAISFGSCSFTEPVEELARLLAHNSTPSA